MKFCDKYPFVEPFNEPVQGVYVTPDHYPCCVCKTPTRFIDYWPAKPRPLCSEECMVANLEAQLALEAKGSL